MKSLLAEIAREVELHERLDELVAENSLLRMQLKSVERQKYTNND